MATIMDSEDHLIIQFEVKGQNKEVALDMKNVVKTVVMEQQGMGVYCGDILGKLEGILQDWPNIAKQVIFGGGHGGPRSNSGRKVHPKGVDWKVYSKPGKKEIEKIKKTNRNIKDFFSKASVSKSVIDKLENDLSDTEDAIDQHDRDDSCIIPPDDPPDANNNDEQDGNWLPNVIELKKRFLEGQKLAFFHNGCFARREERLSQTNSNYTCAIDTIIALGEAILLSGNDNSVAHAISFSPLLLEIKLVLVWRLENEFKWTHTLRNDVWKLLATYFSVAICPIGKVTAVIEPGVKEIEKLWYLEVVIEAVCSEAGCGISLGRFRVVSEELVLSSPLKGELKDKDYIHCQNCSSIPSAIMSTIFYATK